jgi:hypothetical protein
VKPPNWIPHRNNPAAAQAGESLPNTIEIKEARSLREALQLASFHQRNQINIEEQMGENGILDWGPVLRVRRNHGLEHAP